MELHNWNSVKTEIIAETSPLTSSQCLFALRAQHDTVEISLNTHFKNTSPTAYSIDFALRTNTTDINNRLQFIDKTGERTTNIITFSLKRGFDTIM